VFHTRVHLYSPAAFSSYADCFPKGSEIGALRATTIVMQTACWNAFWLLRPNVDFVLTGEITPNEFGIVHGLMPDIIADMGEHYLRFVDHPIKLADWLHEHKPKHRITQPRYEVALPNLWSRVIETSDRFLRDQPEVVQVNSHLMIRQHP